MTLWIFRHLELEWSSFIVWRHIDNHHISMVPKQDERYTYTCNLWNYLCKQNKCMYNMCGEYVRCIANGKWGVHKRLLIHTQNLVSSLFHLCHKNLSDVRVYSDDFLKRLLEVEFKTTFNNFFPLVHYIIHPFLASDWSISLRGTHHESNCLSFSPGCALLVEQVDYQFGRRCWGIHSKDNDTTTHLLFFPSFYYELGGCE